jgi:TolB-like protein/Tfp pilus assembly protein PilF
MTTTRRLAAILAADVAGYSRLMAADEAGTLARFNALRAELIDPKIAQFKGRVVGTAGDSLLVEFASAVDAVQCAVEVQERLAARNAELPENRRMAFRMGVNLGDVIAEGATIHGDGVNVASRLERLAEPGTVVVGRGIYDQVRGKLPYAFADLGEHPVKNIAEPVRAFLVALAERSAPSPVKADDLPLPSKPSVAVLPFTNMSGDPEQEYFSDGITEDIITELSRFRNLNVIARNSTFRWKGQTPKVQDVGRELGAHYVVEGSVRKAGNRVRITAQLIEAVTGNHVWAERYDRDLEDIFAVQDEVTRAIVSTAAYSVEGENAIRVRHRPTDDFRAYDLILRAWAKLYKYAREENEQAVALLEQAIRVDANYARAYSTLAVALLWQHEFAFTDDPAAARRRAIEMAERAVALDASDSFGHAMKGYARLHNREYDLARLHFDRATDLNPNNSHLLSWMGYCQVMQGDHDAGIETLLRARHMNPHLGATDWWALGVAYFSARRYDDAIAALSQVPSEIYEARAIEGACLAYLGREAEAHAAMEMFRARAAREMAHFPGDDKETWRTYWRNSYPYRREVDAELLLVGLRKAGLPI